MLSGGSKVDRIQPILRSRPLEGDKTKNLSVAATTESGDINPFKSKALYILGGTAIMLCWGRRGSP
jgi:hypothetical protein